MNRLKALYRSWAIPCAGKEVYAPRYRAEWLGKISEPGVRRRAEFYYQQLDALCPLRQAVRRDLLLEAKKHKAWKLLRQIPGIGPIRAAVLRAVMQTPHRFRTKRQLWTYCGLGLKTHDSGEYRAVAGQLQRAKKQATVRGLNRDHNHDLKDIFKGAAMRASTAAGPLHENLLAKGLSRDGTKLAFCAVRAGKWELWERSLTDRREEPVIADDDQRRYPQWSSDGRHLVYTRSKASGSAITATSQILMWSAETRTEEPVTGIMDHGALVYDLSPDDKELLVSRASGQEHTGAGNRRSEVWRMSLGSAPHAETSARKLISDAAYDIWQPHFSPNGRWIVFEATRPVTEGLESTLYVLPSAGGQWTRITDGKQWDDKPRWSPDGRTIYFLSRRGGFFNVWGIHFDPEKGRPAGEPFRVSAFERPRLMVPHMISPVALSITKNRLLLTMSKVSGGIWMLDNVDQ